MSLTLIFPYYNNPTILELHYQTWLSYPDRNHFRFIIVDDGSQQPAVDVAPDARQNLPVSIYRVLEDRPWHQHAARNLGAHVAPEGWLLLTDMDHILEADAAEKLIRKIEYLEPSLAYTLHRIEATTRKPTLDGHGKLKPHPNSFVMTRELYWQIGGYDEDFCGIYGTDAFFRQRLPRPLGHLNIPLVRYWRGIIPDASTTSLPRKEGRDPNAKQKVLAAKRARGEERVIKTLQFEWEQVC